MTYDVGKCSDEHGSTEERALCRICAKKMLEDFDISQEETSFPLLQTKCGSSETSIFSMEFTLGMGRYEILTV